MKKSKPKTDANSLVAPTALLTSAYRKNLWKNAEKIVLALESVIPIKEAYLLGSFTTNKRRPADVDFILLVKTLATKDPKWAVDLVITSEGSHGQFVLEDARKWMKQKYGAKKSAVIKLR